MSDDPSPFQPPPFAEPPYSGGDVDLVSEDDDDLEDDDLEDLEDGEDEDGEDEDGDLGSDGGSKSAPPGGAAQALLEHLARSIVDEPESVSIEVGQGRSGVHLALSVAPADMGRIIGKRGRVAQAIRTLVRAAAAHDGTDASVDIVD